MNVSCQFSLYPLGKEDLGEIIYRALDELKKREITYDLGGMSTIFSGDSDEVFSCMKSIFDVAAKEGGVVLTLTLSNACKV